MYNYKIPKCKNCGKICYSKNCYYCNTINEITEEEKETMFLYRNVEQVEFNKTHIFLSIVAMIILTIYFVVVPILKGSGIYEMLFVYFIFILEPIIVLGIPIVRYLLLKYLGGEVDAKVLGYHDSEKIFSKKKLYFVELYIRDESEEMIIYYELKTPEQPYPIDSEILMKRFKNIMTIIDKEKNK